MTAIIVGLSLIYECCRYALAADDCRRSAAVWARSGSAAKIERVVIVWPQTA